eukprot:6176009-Pleurochrysis_carterae.AAC.2
MHIFPYRVAASAELVPQEVRARGRSARSTRSRARPKPKCAQSTMADWTQMAFVACACDAQGRARPRRAKTIRAAGGGRASSGVPRENERGRAGGECMRPVAGSVSQPTDRSTRRHAAPAKLNMNI